MTTYQHKPDAKPNWKPILKPAEITEKRLIKAILDGTFPPDSNLPAERELADSLGVTRPTLRETLQRLERDGWVEIHQGKPTRVKDYLREGRLGVLNSLAGHLVSIPQDFVENLLEVRLAMAPMYTALAVKKASDQVIKLLEEQPEPEDVSKSFSEFDWNLQHQLTLLSGNPVFVMILNSFEDLYLKLAPLYFSIPEARQRSIDYYQELIKAAEENDTELAKDLTEEIMQDSVKFWRKTDFM